MISEMSVAPPRSEQRMARYAELPGVQSIPTSDIGIVGCGAIGRTVALTLASMGCERLTLYDPDKINTVNLGSQGWDQIDVGHPKVKVLAESCNTKNAACSPAVAEALYPTSTRSRQHEVLFVCVDTMKARKAIFRKTRIHPSIVLIDTRMGLYVGHLILDRKPLKLWETTLFTDEEAAEAPCGLQAIAFAAQAIASWGISLFMQALARPRKFDPCEIRLDLFAHTITVSTTFKK